MRLIDADALKMEFPKDEDWHYPVNTNSFVCELIDAQPTVKPERKKEKWIPCEERLPEEDKDVLVSVHFKGLEQRHKTGWNDHIKESWYVDIASHIDGNWASYSDEYKVASNRHEVIAWMPLPEPYKGEE